MTSNTEPLAWVVRCFPADPDPEICTEVHGELAYEVATESTLDAAVATLTETVRDVEALELEDLDRSQVGDNRVEYAEGESGAWRYEIEAILEARDVEGEGWTAVEVNTDLDDGGVWPMASLWATRADALRDLLVELVDEWDDEDLREQGIDPATRSELTLKDIGFQVCEVSTGQFCIEDAGPLSERRILVTRVKPVTR